MKPLALALLLGSVLIGTPAVAVDLPITTVSNANYTALSTDQRIITTGAVFSAPRTLTLNSAGATCIGQTCSPTLYLDVIDAVGAVSPTNTWTITPASGETINGSTASVVLTAPYSKVQLQPISGSNWTATFSASDVQTFTASGTYTARLGISFSQVTVCGAGGGGGGGGARAV